MRPRSKLTISLTAALLTVVSVAAVDARDKYSLKSPSGIAFSDFKGYEDWAVVSSAEGGREAGVGDRNGALREISIGNQVQLRRHRWLV